MQRKRVVELESNPGLPLTDKEYKDGWHRCKSEWDGLLIHTSWPEYQYCDCFEDPEDYYNETKDLGELED